ncbi:MAG: DUF2726 domain-containing protein [Oscillospiraceae bacterium]|nr:DUF2726 domain-containing protein [Oscillospiraceae bacterium]
MKCKVCGAESGQYVLCRECNEKKNKGEIIKCKICNEWHYKDKPCKIKEKVPEIENSDIKTDENKAQPTANENYLYELKQSLLTKNEISYYNVIKKVIPENYLVFPQINLASFIERTDDSRFHNELFRNVDFLITDDSYRPKVVIEINDQSHLTTERKKRDEKVRKICEEAGIPIIKLWTSYGINSEYISKRIIETLSSLPIKRICHSKDNIQVVDIDYYIAQRNTPQKTGCYIATCVYGSYDCSNVWVLRRFRDNSLNKTLAGRLFIKMYYAISPIVVKYLGNSYIFRSICKSPLDMLVKYLKSKGFKDTPYTDA